MPDPVTAYLKNVEKELQAGNTTEHSHRPHLKNLIESCNKDILAINEPKRVKCGAPDYIVVKEQTPLGYIECKDVGISLDHEEKSEQMGRYRSGLLNLILTDYLEFRWYVNGEFRCAVRLGKIALNKIQVDEEGVKKFLEMMNSFLTTQIPTVDTSSDLAQRMAALARLVRDAINKALSDADKGGTLGEQMQGFREALLHDLTEAEFADMYAQTISYGLFAARCNSDPAVKFSREHAAYDLPKTNPFLRKMFSHIAGPDLDDRVVWIVDNLADLLQHCDMSAILQDFGKKMGREDPVVHFYETFLTAYDPNLRELRGVYYTPEPVVSYIVRSIDLLLKRDFGLAGGLADASKVDVKAPSENKSVHKVQILDPACGTGTFLYGVVDRIHDSFRGNEGMWSGYVSEHLLPRLWGFELLPAPYAVAHMKLGLQLKESGYDFQADERLKVYLTNTLEEAKDTAFKLPFAQWIADEANAAGKVKSEGPVMVVLGNPPYSGHSANKGEWIKNLLRGNIAESPANYFKVDGKVLSERNPKWLNDDYVKFIRFGQWRIEKTGSGILAFITNHSYLDNPTFRGMRHSLMNTFSEIYILNLHGSARKKEVSPKTSENENIFEIQQGTAIGIFVKKVNTKAPAKVHHGDLWGTRPQKHRKLSEEDALHPPLTALTPVAPFYFFVPLRTEWQEEYNTGWRIADAMPVHSVGVVSGRDDLTIKFSPQEIINTVKQFSNLPEDEARRRFKLRKDAQDWKVALAQKDILENGVTNETIVEVLYRPFDVRSTFYTGRSAGFLCRSRYEVMRHILAGENLGLSTTKSVEIGRGWEHVFCSSRLIQHHTVSLKEVNYLFPLYLYPRTSDSGKYARLTLIQDTQKRIKESGRTTARDVQSEQDRMDQLIRSLFSEEHYTRIPNFNPDFIEDIRSRLNLRFLPEKPGDLLVDFGPEDIFGYVYALLHSPIYRERYSEFLKSDFPRIQLTSNPDLFRSLCSLGKELVELHLLKKYSAPSAKYPVKGDDVVEKVKYTEPGQGDDDGRVWINEKQYFKGIPREVWEFHVGGYRICEKWLKDRKGRVLSYDDLTHYQRIVSALAETIRIMGEIDAVIEDHGGFPIHTNAQPKK